MVPVKKLLAEKSIKIISITQEDNVFQAVRMMNDNQISTLPVLENGKLVGIISERDCTRRVLLKCLDPKVVSVGDVMTKNVITISPDNSLDDCMNLIHNKRLRHLPVLKDSKLIGIISIGDVLKEVIAIREHTIEQLGDYISQSG